MKLFNVVTVAKIAQEMGIEVTKVARGNCDEDGEVTLANGFHVQVGESYLMVNQELPGDVFMFGPEITTTTELKRELSKLAA